MIVGRTLKFDDFIDKTMNLDNLKYEEYYDKLQGLYGKKNVFEFEKLLNETKNTLEDICSFIRYKVPSCRIWIRNVGYSKNQMKISLSLNSCFENGINKRGMPYQYTKFFLPHRYIFQSRIFSWIPKKLTLTELVKNKETKIRLKEIENKGA